MTQEFKPISEWIAEGKERAELIGYVDQDGEAIQSFKISGQGELVIMARGTAQIQRDRSTSHPVAPPVQSRLSDEELVRQFQNAVTNEWMADCRSSDNKFSAKTNALRTQVLERMKGNARLQKQLDAVERLRPHWAQGYTDDSMAAQAKTAALSQLWDILGVSDQTAAVQKLRAMKGPTRGEVEEMLRGVIECLTKRHDDEKFNGAVNFDALNKKFSEKRDTFLSMFPEAEGHAHL